jgi:hypothetical protein
MRLARPPGADIVLPLLTHAISKPHPFNVSVSPSQSSNGVLLSHHPNCRKWDQARVRFRWQATRTQGRCSACVNTCSRATSRGLMMRTSQLAKRFERREEAKADGEEAKETGRLPHSCHSPRVPSSSVPQAQQKTWNVSRDEQSK